MGGEAFTDPVLEFAARAGDDAFGVFELGATDEEARLANEALDEVDAEEAASSIVGRLRHQGHIL